MTDDAAGGSGESVVAKENTSVESKSGSCSSAIRPSLSSSVFRLITGRGVAIVFSIATAPIVSRLYGPEDFGITELTIAMMVFLYPCCSGFCYGLAMPLAASPIELRAIYALSTGLGALVTALVGWIAAYHGAVVVSILGYPELAPYTLIAPILCATFVVRNLVDMLLSCERRFGIVAVRSVFEVLGRRLTQIMLGVTFLGHTATGLLIGVGGGAVAGALAFSVKPMKTAWQADGQPLRLADLKNAAIRFRKFPLFRFWSEMLSAAAYATPALLLGFLFSTKVVGYFGFGRPLLFLPLNLLTRASRDVFFVEAAEAAKNGHSAEPATLHMLKLLAVFLSFPFTVVCLLGAGIFEVVFGPTWREAGIYAQLLLPGVAITAVGMPLTAIFDSRDKMGEGLFLNIILVVVQGAAMILGSFLADPNSIASPRLALAFSTVGTVFVWIHVIRRTLTIAEASHRKAAKILLLPYVEAFLLLVPASLLYWIANMPLVALGAVGVACLAHAWILHRRHPRISQRLRDFFARRASDTAHSAVESAS